MRWTDLANKTFPRRLNGYDPTSVRTFLTEIAAAGAALNEECASLRADLGSRVHSHEAVSLALIDAQRLAAELKEQAEKTAASIVAAAKEEAQQLLAETKRQQTAERAAHDEQMAATRREAAAERDRIARELAVYRTAAEQERQELESELAAHRARGKAEIAATQRRLDDLRSTVAITAVRAASFLQAALDAVGQTAAWLGSPNAPTGNTDPEGTEPCREEAEPRPTTETKTTTAAAAETEGDGVGVSYQPKTTAPS